MARRRPSSQQRSAARRLALQALYQWQVAGQDVLDIERQFLSSEETADVDIDYFRQLLRGVPARLRELDAHLGPLLDRPIGEVDPIERSLLRMGAYELAFHPEVPFRVAINEAVELDKTFGAEQGHRYINGVLDKLARRLRTDEVSAAANRSPRGKATP
jgi:transcription antitermination protein NusB